MIAVFAAGAVACGEDDEDGDGGATSTEAAPAAEIPVVDVIITDQGFDAPDSVPGGLTGIRADNRSAIGHGVQLVRLKDGATLEQFHAAIILAAEDFTAAKDEIDRLTFAAGGIAKMLPGGTSEVVLDLDPGRHVLVSYIIGTPFTRPLEVTAAQADRPAEPEAQHTIRMSEFAFDGAPDTLPAGPTTVEVVNEGEQVHQMSVVSEESLTAEQVQQSLTGTPLPLGVSFGGSDGGMGELAPGDSGWVTLDLDPGVYVLTCAVFDTGKGTGGSGKGHSELGMQHVITVE